MSFLTELPENLYVRDAFRDFSATSAYSVANARTMMWLAQLPYERDAAKIGRIAKVWGFTSAERIVGNISLDVMLSDTAGVVVARPEAVVVSIAGTDPLKLANWITNFTADIGKEKNTHHGFQDAADALWGQIEPRLNATLAANPQAKLFFTGHSLGAALTALAASRAADNKSVAAVYTYGMPRTGGPIFAAAYDARLGDRTFRLRFGQDIVATIPPRAFGFQHVGRYIFCPRGRFADVAASAISAVDQPDLVENELDKVRKFLSQPEPIQLPFVDRFKLLLHPLAAAGPPARPDLVGAFIEQLPPPIRDHAPQSYFGALAPTVGL